MTPSQFSRKPSTNGLFESVKYWMIWLKGFLQSNLQSRQTSVAHNKTRDMTSHKNLPHFNKQHSSVWMVTFSSTGLLRRRINDVTAVWRQYFLPTNNPQNFNLLPKQIALRHENASQNENKFSKKKKKYVFFWFAFQSFFFKSDVQWLENND